MSFKKLTQAIGEVADDNGRPDDLPGKIVRPAILVHSGPDGSMNVLHSSDGDIGFDDARIQDIVKRQNARTLDLAQQYGGLEKMPMGAWPPILDQHSDDSNDRIRGRLTGILKYEKRDVPKVGKNVSCAISYPTFLGEDNCQKVHDGRIYHLSVGIDDEPESETYNTLGEVSTVIEPAAPGAMLLKKAKKRLSVVYSENYKGHMIDVLKVDDEYFCKIDGTEPPTRNEFMSQGEALNFARKFVVNFKLGEKKMSKLMKSKLAEAVSELKKLGAKGEVTKTKLIKTEANVQLAKRAEKVTKRLSALCASHKMTPAEFKLIPVKRLAKMSDEDMETALITYEARQPQVLLGQVGTTSAAPAGELAINLEKKQLKTEATEMRKRLKKMGNVKFKDEKDEGKQLEGEKVPAKKMPLGDAKEESKLGGSASESFEKLKKHLEDKKDEEGKACLAEVEKEMGKKSLELGDSEPAVDGGMEPAALPTDIEQELSDIKEQMDEQAVQIARVAGIVEQAMSDEEDSEQPQEDSEMKDEKDEDKKEAVAGDQTVGDDKKEEEVETKPGQKA